MKCHQMVCYRSGNIKSTKYCGALVCFVHVAHRPFKIEPFQQNLKHANQDPIRSPWRYRVLIIISDMNFTCYDEQALS